MSNYIERDIFVLRDVSCVAQPIEYVQGTNAVPILLHLRDFEIPEESTARVYVEWPSTKGEYDEVDIEGNDVHIDVKDTMFSEVGKCYLQICIVNGDDTLVTFKYPVVVKENRVPGITSPSQNKSNFLDEYIQNLDERLMRTDELLQQTIENAQEVEGNTLIVEEKAEVAKQNAIISQSYAVGGTGTRENEDVENAKFYYEQAERIAQGLSGTLLPCGTITFEELSEVQALPGYMYNMSDAFVSDERFLHSGISHGVGANIYMTIDGKWDVLAGSNVLSVNGKTGVVILKAADIQCEDGETVQSKLNKIGTISDLTTGIKDTIVAAINWLNNSLTALSNSLTSLAKRVSTNETAISDLNTNFSKLDTNLKAQVICESYSFGKQTIEQAGQFILNLEMPTKEGYTPYLVGMACNSQRDVVSQGYYYNASNGCWMAFFYSNYANSTSFTANGTILWIRN